MRDSLGDISRDYARFRVLAAVRDGGGDQGDNRMVRGAEMKASAEWVHLEHSRIKLHDEGLH